MIRHLYVHVPFCHRICPYCAFYKHQPGAVPFDAFVDAVLAELDTRRRTLELAPSTIYFGGGTPSLLPTATLNKLCQGLRDRLDLSGLVEWTVEANPMTFDEAKAAAMRDAGVTRVSLGVQSWTPRFLELLGRDHSPEQAAESYHILRAVKFPAVNVDLMFALPGQTLDDWRADLETTLSLQPDHVSAYNLTYEEDTAFFERLGQGPYRDDEPTNAEHFALADELLTEAGFRHYEISNYAQPGLESVHNRAYWSGEDYLGLGPGAVSTVAGQRWKNLPNTTLYVQLARSNAEALATERETLTARDLRNERVALLLRTDEGLPLALLDPTPRRRAEELVQEGLLERRGDHLRLTQANRALVDPVAAELIT